MKIIMPYNVRHGISIDSEIVVGGIETFARNVYKHIPGIIPIPFTDDERPIRGHIAEKIHKAALEHGADMILTNYDFAPANYRVAVKNPQIPIMWVNHMGGGPFSKLKEIEHMNEMRTKFFNSVFMMSEHQYDSLFKMTKRFAGTQAPLRPDGIIHPAFCNGDEKVVDDIVYDTITIGRSDIIKDPFWLHRKFRTVEHLRNVVFTDGPFDDKYSNENLKLANEYETHRNVPYAKLMGELSRSGVYVSTCPQETRGIAILEAMARGLPALITVDTSGHSACEMNAADPSHYMLTRKSAKLDEIVEKIDTMRAYSYDKRVEISEMTKEKNNFNVWKSAVENAIDMTMEKKKKFPSHTFF